MNTVLEEAGEQPAAEKAGHEAGKRGATGQCDSLSIEGVELAEHAATAGNSIPAMRWARTASVEVDSIDVVADGGAERVKARLRTSEAVFSQQVTAHRMQRTMSTEVALDLRTEPDSTHSSTTNLPKQQSLYPIKRFSCKRDAARRLRVLVILPTNNHKCRWDMYIMILLLYCSVVVPFQIGFDFFSAEIDLLDWFVDVSFGVDIILACITAYPCTDIPGEYVTDRKKILKHYAMTWMVFDGLAFIPFHRILDAEESYGMRLAKLIRLLRITRIFKVVRVIKLFAMVQRSLIREGMNTGFMRIMVILCWAVVVAHVIGCFWHHLALADGTDFPALENSWLTHYEGLLCDDLVPCKDTLWLRYWSSGYWAMATLTTVGYGDIGAHTSTELAYACFVMMCGVTWYAYVVSSMSSVLFQFEKRSVHIHDKHRKVSKFMNASGFPPELRHMVWNALYEVEDQSKNQSTLAYDVDMLLGELPAKESEAVVLFLNRALIAQIPFLDRKNTAFVCRFVLSLKGRVLEPGDTIMQETAMSDEIFFLVKGKALATKKQQFFASVSSPTFFGEVGVILGNRRVTSVTAQTVCVVYILSRMSILDLIFEVISFCSLF